MPLLQPSNQRILTTRSNYSRRLLVVCSLFWLAVGLIVGYTAATHRGISAPPPQSPSTPATTLAPTTDSLPVSSPPGLTYMLGTTIPAEWKSYHSDQYHFSLRYPPTWTISIPPTGVEFRTQHTVLKGAEGWISIPTSEQGGGCSYPETTWVNGRLFDFCHSIDAHFSDGPEQFWQPVNEPPADFEAMARNGEGNALTVMRVISTIRLDN